MTCQKFGIEGLVDQKLWELLLTISHHLDSSVDISLFCDFLSERWAADEFGLFLACRYLGKTIILI